jgi:hypothetical protein
MKGRHLMLIMWPSFLMAGVASGVVFALIDPLDVAIFGYITPKREVMYAMAFFFFWFIASMSSLLSLYLMPRPGEENEADLGF